MTELIEKLSQSRSIWLESVAGVDDEEAMWRRAEGSWSMLECAEHVANVEFRILRTIQKARPVAASSPNPEREADIYALTSSRDQKIPAPDPVRPVGRYASLGEAADAFARHRDAAIGFLRGYAGDLRAIGETHPILGPCNGYEYVLIMAAHPIRHAGQIREIRQAYRAR